MHQAVKNIGIYSGVTVLGDGNIAMILDILGISRHANVSMNTDIDNLNNKNASKKTSFNDSQDLLLFRSGKEEQCAVALTMIKRIERIKIKAIENIGGKAFILIKGISTRVIRLENFLKVSPPIMSDEMFFLIPKHITYNFGILISHLTDIGNFFTNPNSDSYIEKGIFGTDILQGHMTILIDLFGLIEKTEPQWCRNRKKMSLLQKKI